MMTLC